MTMKTIISLLLLPFYCCAQYMGTASVTQGLATTTISNLYNCTGGRIAALGTITATDASTWTVPAETQYSNTGFPFASDLNNVCNGHNYATANAALAALNGSDIVTIDPSGELITAYVFADNYFEMYINGIPVGKDNVPFTQFNSSIVRFKVHRPFTIAMLLIDWEERLGVGCETNGGFSYHCGDGGMVAVFKDAANNIIATTGPDWKAQTFYTAPIMDLSCPTENGTLRLSGNCSTANSNFGSSYYGLHWSKPANWQNAAFVDTSWPSATTYSNATIGVDNKPAYTNFTGIFDDPSNDAQFIWSTNVVLDNEVIVRKTVPAALSVDDRGDLENQIQVFPNPARDYLTLSIAPALQDQIQKIAIYNLLGEEVFAAEKSINTIPLNNTTAGIYILTVSTSKAKITRKIIIE